MDTHRLDTSDPGFDAALARLLDRAPTDDPAVTKAVERIVADVRARGDAALLEYTNRFDRSAWTSADDLELPRAALAAAWNALPPALRDALEQAHARIRAYAERQPLEPFEFGDALGNRLGQRITPLDRVGIYVPGGKAAYPSSVLMNAVPARVAGVPEIVMVVPTPGGETNPAVLGAAHLAGVDRVFRIGGAQAVAALAYGTARVP
jgi:histidinol dehydrogenase